MGSLISVNIILQQWDLKSVPPELLWYLTAAFIVLAMAYLSSVFYFRSRIKLKTSRKAEIKKELAPMISKFLFFTEEDPLEFRREYVQLKIAIRDLLRDKLTRTVLSEILQDLKKDVSGSARKELLNLYNDLGLQEDALQNLKSRHWEVLSRAILELTEMEVQGAYGLIKRHINHRSSIVRKQAQIATVSLKSEGINYFLDTNRYPISEWQQLKLLDVIRHMEGFEVPKFKNWLTSKNNYVVLFALRLIKYYKQNDAQKAIIRLINHRNQLIKIEAIQCIREFFIQDAKETLKKAFSKGNEEVKLLTLDTLGLIGDEEDIEFLQNIANKSITHIISSKALSVINTLKPETILPETGVEFTEDTSHNLTEDNSENMEKEEEKELSVQLPKPDFQVNPMAWEDLLDPDLEDELIFSHCCLEEFRELIQEIGEPLVQAGDPGALPLDFLPIVMLETEEQTKETANKMDQPTENRSKTNRSEVYPKHPEERITREIESLLDFELDDKPEFHEVEDVFNLNFLPILVDDSSHVEEGNTDGVPDFHTIEVIAETLKYKVPDAFDKSSKTSENYSLHIPPEESFEAVKAINWSAIASQNLQFALPEEESRKVEIKEEDETQYGFSIFQELFRSADTESKLILLDEVLAIGDEKELYFLRSLSEDPSAHVRKKAALILEELTSHLMQEDSETMDLGGQESQMEEDSPDFLFDLNFEPSLDKLTDAEDNSAAQSNQATKVKEEAGNQGTFMGRFITLTHKMFEKIYG